MLNYDSISIKSKIGVEFRRYALKMKDITSFLEFYKQIEKYHHLETIPFVIFYLDQDDFLLPINNDDNLAKAIHSAKHITLYDHTHTNHTNHNTIATTTTPSTISTITSDGRLQHHDGYTLQQAPPVILRRPYLWLLIEKKGVFLDYYNGNLSGKYKKGHAFRGISNMILPAHDQNQNRPSIGMPANFRQVSSIIDADILPETCRRVRIVKHGSDRPLGFYIRDGTYKRMNSDGQLELVNGIFISRLVPGGLAESTGLLAVNDEVLEVNGIGVTQGKTLDQVTDMMVANSSNLIITIRPGRTNELR